MLTPRKLQVKNKMVISRVFDVIEFYIAWSMFPNLRNEKNVCIKETASQSRIARAFFFEFLKKLVEIERKNYFILLFITL